VPCRAGVDAVGAAVIAPGDRSNATAQLAAELGAAKVTRQPVETVLAILMAHNDGDPLNRIAAYLGVHHSAVKRVLEAAGANSQRDPPAAVRKAQTPAAWAFRMNGLANSGCVRSMVSLR